MSPCTVPTALASGLYVTTQSQPSASSWEYLTTLGYEWDVIRGHRPYRWTILVSGLLSGFQQKNINPHLSQIYSITRAATLLSIVLNMMGFDSSVPIYCQVSPLFNVRVYILKLSYAFEVWITFIAVSISCNCPDYNT